MKIYLDLIFFINLIFDFLLLTSVSLVLKRNIKWYRLIFGSLIGAFSIFILFIEINNIQLFIFKLIISIVMIISAFSYKNIKYTFNNFITLYIISVFLGGALYLLNIEYSYRNSGLVFYHHGLSINFIVMIIISPIILYLYIKSYKKIKYNFQNNYKVDLIINHKKYQFDGYIDTGNQLHDQYKKRPICLIVNNKIKYSYKDVLFVPYETVNGHGIIKCLKAEYMYINHKKYEKVLVGIVDHKFHLEGINMIIHNDYKEDLI
ncbi:MAG: hypothetical protein GX861_00760 [Tenericutes bacterium]|jgi:stage II sporulation protein GA (sporulation sigma-E factor processing peptidase)|nr:hypothetical protein [Mycoplasmatota bacterium]